MYRSVFRLPHTFPPFVIISDLVVIEKLFSV